MSICQYISIYQYTSIIRKLEGFFFKYFQCGHSWLHLDWKMDYVNEWSQSFAWNICAREFKYIMSHLPKWLIDTLSIACDEDSATWENFLEEIMTGSEKIMRKKYEDGKRFSELSAQEQANVVESQYLEVCFFFKSWDYSKSDCIPILFLWLDAKQESWVSGRFLKGIESGNRWRCDGPALRFQGPCSEHVFIEFKSVGGYLFVCCSQNFELYSIWNKFLCKVVYQQVRWPYYSWNAFDPQFKFTTCTYVDLCLPTYANSYGIHHCNEELISTKQSQR